MNVTSPSLFTKGQILRLIKFKAFADNKIGTSIFTFFHNFFKRFLFQGQLKEGIVW